MQHYHSRLVWEYFTAQGEQSRERLSDLVLWVCDTYALSDGDLQAISEEVQRQFTSCYGWKETA